MMPLSRMFERIVPDIADVPADVWRYLLLAVTIPVSAGQGGISTAGRGPPRGTAWPT